MTDNDWTKPTHFCDPDYEDCTQIIEKLPDPEVGTKVTSQFTVDLMY